MALVKSDLKAIQNLINDKEFRISDEDFAKIKDLVNITIEEKTQDLLVTKEEIRHLPTKEEFYVSEDRLMKELKDIREEITILTGMKRQVWMGS